MTSPTDKNASEHRPLKRLLDDAIRRLEESGITSARRSAEWLLCEATGLGRTDLYAHPNILVESEAISRFDAMLVRRLRHEPLQYILGCTEFYGIHLELTPAVLIPRPETEEVVGAALGLIDERTAPRVLDVGTGSGCIAIAIKHERPDAGVWAFDISDEALSVARRNAATNRLDIQFFLCDVWKYDAVDAMPRNVDLVIANPPYVTEEERAFLESEVRDYEPHLALFAGTDPLLAYRRIASMGSELLADGGWIVFETHAEFGIRVAEVLGNAGYVSVGVRRDLMGLPRIVLGKKA